MTKAIKNKDNMKAELARISFDVPANLKNTFKAKAALLNKDMREILAEFVEGFVKENSKKQN